MENDVTYPDPYSRPAPDRFIRRWLVITGCIAALMLLWQFLPAIEAWFSPREAAERTVTPRGDLAADEQTTIQLFEKSRGSVVYITTAQLVRDVWSRNVFSVPRGTSSGFIWDDAGHVVTNFHVIQGASSATVKLADGRDYQAALVGASPEHDIAVLKIGVGFKRPPAVPVGTSADLQVGQKVIAIGNPFGLEQTVTVGIVSAKGRVIGAGPYDDFIQTDASINPGNSGGPLFNAKGEVIGINTAIVRGGQGIGFATPVNAAKNIIPQLRDKGKVTRGWLGVTVQDVSADLAKSFGLEEAQGALVSEVVQDSPADKAGIKRGDIILSLNDNEINILNDLPRLVSNRTVGEKVEIVLFRNGKKVKVKAVLASTPEEETVAKGEPGDDTSKLGMAVSEVTPEIMRFYNLK